MPLDDKFLALKVRRALAKVEADTSQLEILASNGVIYLSGYLRPLKGAEVAVSLRQQLEHIVDIAKSVRNVRDVVDQVKLLG